MGMTTPTNQQPPQAVSTLTTEHRVYALLKDIVEKGTPQNKCQEQEAARLLDELPNPFAPRASAAAPSIAPLRVSLARLAELDAAAPKGPWYEVRPADSDKRYYRNGVVVGVDSDEMQLVDPACPREYEEALCAFIAAAKGFAPALVRRLEALAGWWERHDSDALYPEDCAAELRALIRGGDEVGEA